MNNRWRMNRMGFINFWLYDEEIFNFADGKLFLRGANAAGKSITTQSMIPFILDGDRSPQRLDPFGSKDRRMEYYFLDCKDQDEATGYLFLEFKKEDSNQYRTIGIGQRAQRGKPMSFWGFVLLDGRRIGYDMALYHSVGDKRIPLSKQDLKKLISEPNEFAETQKEYMQMVNKHIFGFPRLEQYDQFIRLMIKVRAPKLSRDFKPTQVYEILNESLQTLSDEDLRAMVEAMEKMDDIQTKLDALKLAYKDVQIIKNEYDRYNRFMLGKKAADYLKASKEASSSHDKLKLLQASVQKDEEDKCAKVENNSQLDFEVKALEQEKSVLGGKNIDETEKRLREKQAEQKGLSSDLKQSEEKIETHRRKIRIYQADLREYEGETEEYRHDIELTVQELDEINETLCFQDGVTMNAQLMETDFSETFRRIKALMKDYKQAITKGYDALKELRDAEDSWNVFEEGISGYRLNHDVQQQEMATAEAMEQQERNRLIETYHKIASNYEQLKLSRNMLQSIVGFISTYAGPMDFGNIKAVTDGCYDEKRCSLLDKQRNLQKQKGDLEAEYKAATAELEQLQAMKSPIPPRKERTVQARQMLTKEGIVHLPFYEAVEFTDGLSSEQQSLIEQQLTDAGMLDALVVAPNDMTQAKLLLKDLSDTLLAVTKQSLQESNAGFQLLCPGDIEDGLKQGVLNILKAISPARTDAPSITVLCDDGYFRNGIVEGYCIGEEETSFVGKLARKNKMARLIEEQEQLCDRLKKEISDLTQRLSVLNENIRILQQEKDELPNCLSLNEHISLVQRAEYQAEIATKELEKKERELDVAVERKKQCQQKAVETCRQLPLSRTLEAYGDALAECDDYQDKLSDLSHSLSCYQTCREKQKGAGALIETAETAIEDIDIQMQKHQRDLRLCTFEIKNLEDFLNKPENKELAQKLKQLNESIEEKNGIIQQNAISIGILSNQIASALEEQRQMKESLVGFIEKERLLFHFYEEELKLGLVIKQGDRSAAQCATEAAASIREGDRDRSPGDVTASLNKNFQQHNSSLIAYGTQMIDWFDDNGQYLRRRQCIFSNWQGKKLSVDEFHTVLRGAIEDNELLIQDNDRKLFEDILADTISRKLNGRIQESRKWIKDMSAIMQEMDTSMGLTFSLDWRPHSAGGEGELDTAELEKLLSRDKNLLTREDIEKVSAHFRSKISAAKQAAEDNDEVINYADLIREALDYRHWFEFRMHFHRLGDSKKELTNSAFNRFSGGEKAMAMYVPLFAAVSSQYKKADARDFPRIIALDEAFAGVDDRNISSMFELVHKLDFDYIMNSQALWGCYETVNNLRISELLRAANSQVVTIIHYYWNGRERILDE